MAARPRLSEEVLRLMRGGAAHRSMWLLWEMGMLDVLIPELSAYVADSEEDEVVWNLLTEVDHLTKEGDQPLDDVVLWSALLLEPLLEACHEEGDRLRAAHDFLEPIVERLNLPRRSSDAIRRIVSMLPRIAEGRAARFTRSPLYPMAEQVLQIRKDALARGNTEDRMLPPPKKSAKTKPRRSKRSRGS